MFVRVETRRRRHLPWATLAIVSACLLLFLFEGRSGGSERNGLLAELGTIPTRLVTAWHSGGIGWLREVQRLFTGLFLHADWPHLIGNLVFVLIFGFASERLLGSLRFLALFLLCGALANLAGAVVYAEVSGPIIGSSGAVSAIVGAYITLFPQARLGLVIPLGFYFEFVRMPASILIGLWILTQFLFVIVGPESSALAWPIHVAGFILGMLFAFLSRPAIARRLRND
jgi:membrane associated rhomboid family serine protease